MRYFNMGIIICALLSLTHSFPVDAMESREKWALQLEQMVNEEPNLSGAIAGISVRSAETGQILYDHFGDYRLRPASNLKLITASTALSVLGERYTFTTEVLTNGRRENNKLNGNLFLKGKGDPTLLHKDFNQIASELRQHGITIVQGDLLGDDTWYDNVRYSVDLPWSDEQTYYGAPISALTAAPTTDYDAGTVLLQVKPGKEIGGHAVVKMTPKTNPLKIKNQTKVISDDGTSKVTIERAHRSNKVEISGMIPQNSKPIKEWISVENPTLYAVQLFRQSLKEQGIELKGKAKTGITPMSAQILISHKSMTLSELLIPFLKSSNNGHAEVLVKEMGKFVWGEGSWEKGLKVVREEVGKLGVEPDQIVLRDGSGVSHVNLVTANQLSQLLFAAQKETWFPSFYQSLPVAGEPSKMVGGTLRKRLKETNLRGKIAAKTGTISTVSALSGYVKTKSGKTLIFSILLNNLLDEANGKALEDKLVRKMAQS